MTERDLPDTESVQQHFDVGPHEPDDEAVRPSSTKKAFSQRREINLSVHEGVEHVGEVAPFTDAAS
jgi:hypothetical protein